MSSFHFNLKAEKKKIHTDSYTIINN